VKDVKNGGQIRITLSTYQAVFYYDVHDLHTLE